MLDHITAYALWIAPGLTVAATTWILARAADRIQRRRRARAALREAHRAEAALQDAGQHLADVIAADAELDRRIRQLGIEARRDGQQ